ncbi:MAG: hypothetical protein ABII06_10200, partial [Pseudomonadota bacterium]
VLPILLGFYRNYFQLNKTGAILAMTVGGCFALIGKIGGFTDFGLYGFFLSGLVLILGSKLGHTNESGQKK